MNLHRPLLTAILACAFVAATGSAVAQDGTAAPRVRPAPLGRLPLYFVENRGVHPDEVRYYIEGADKTLFFADRGITVALKGKSRAWAVKLDFLGASLHARPTGFEKQQAVFSYFTGAEKDWKTGLPTFAKVIYRDLWPGIDLVYNGTINKLKYEFVVAPGADPRRIRLRYRGATEVTATGAGALRVATPEGSFEDAPPVAWQDVDGTRMPVAMTYALGEDGRFGFTVGDYDRTRPLVLDPAVIVYCGYIGGDNDDMGGSPAVDRHGCLYLTGSTTSSANSFPFKVGPSKTRRAGYDAYVAKVDASGSGLVYCGYLAGSSQDFAGGVTIDGAGNAYVVGRTESKDFPVSTGWPYRSHAGGYTDAFIAKVNAAGTGLVYSGYLGGSSIDGCTDVALDAHGNAHVTGWTYSTNLPVLGGPSLKFAGGTEDAWVAKVNAAGTALVYCGYLGGDKSDEGGSVAVNAAGHLILTGYVLSSELTFPAKNAKLTKYQGGGDLFVAELSPQGVLLKCGYFGGAGLDAAASGRSLAIGPQGFIYIAGATDSTEKNGFPVAGGPDPTYNGGIRDAFVAKLNPKDFSVVYCGYIGGSDQDANNTARVAVDRQGCAYVASMTLSDERTEGFPVKLGPDLTYNGERDSFVAKVKADGSGLVYCGYIGGKLRDSGPGIAVDASGCLYAVGRTANAFPDFPVAGGLDPSYNGGSFDAYVAKVALLDVLTVTGIPRTGTAVSLNLAAIEARNLPYRLGTSLGAGPIRIDTRRLGLTVDPLLGISVGGRWPHVFQAYSGMIDGQGQAAAAIRIPNVAKLKGIQLHTAYVTLDPTWRSGIRSISQTLTITIQ